jgi:PAS domain S-box-containing protein
VRSRTLATAPPLAALSHDLMAALDDGRILWANDAWRRVLGWTPEELAGTPLADLLHADDELGAGGEATVRLRTRSGGLRRLTMAMATDAGITYVCGREAASVQELEHELRAAEDRFRAVTEATITEAILTADARGRITYANGAACAMFGWEAHELLGQPFTILVPERHREPHRARLRGMLSQGLTAEIKGVRRDGSEFPIEVALGSWERDGRRAYTAILRDVTERRATLRALELSHARYQALVANLPHVIVTLYDTDLQVLVFEGGHLVERSLDRERFAARPELMPPLRAALGGEPQAFEHTDGEVVYEIQAVPLRGDDERVIGVVSVARDVTELRQALRGLEERAGELERSNAELAEFAYVASHDLSEPLRMISSYLQLLRRRHGDDLAPEADEFVGHAIDGATRMRALIEDLLAYSRAGRSEAPPAPVDVDALVASIAPTVISAHAEPRPVIEWSELPTVPGEASQLAQLLQNLISNAVKFVAPGAVPYVLVTAERDGDLWRFAVDDNGIGIEPRHAERIFGMFQRLHSRDAFAGTGIGLAIARKVVERHGGRIWVEPRPEGGTRFLFTLPA